MKPTPTVSIPRRSLLQSRLPSLLLRLGVAMCLSLSIAEAAPIGSTAAELRASKAFEQARKDGPLTLRAFLLDMPKGADLHSHLSGAIYAESLIRAAGEDALCVNINSLSLEKTAAMTMSIPPQPVCGEGRIAASRVPPNSDLYNGLIDAFSMRSFVPSPSISGHDHFFATFGHFDGTSPHHGGEWLDEVATRAARQNEQYLELMETPPHERAKALAKELGWNPDLKQFRDDLLAHGLDVDVVLAQKQLQQALDQRKSREKCGTAAEEPACKVEVRFLYQVLRGFPPEQVFAQALLGFEVASADPDVVGLNFVMPEDGFLSMRDYRLQMHMLDYLHSVYPTVNISLHAGELAPGLVPPEGLTFHIRLAVEQGHAQRIGHGVDVMYEGHPYRLLKEMADRHVLVEINLTSNDVILGVKGPDHPLMIYRKYGVPVALSTDDEGVSRIDLTNEYVRAAMTYPLSYGDLKTMARAGIEHSFLPGQSLWKATDVYTRTADPCATQPVGTPTPAKTCSTFLQSSAKARQQWELERRFRIFEAEIK